MSQKMAGSFFCLAVYSAEYYSPMWLSVQHDCAVWSSDNKRDHCEILFTINNDSRWGMHDRVIERADQVLG